MTYAIIALLFFTTPSEASTAWDEVHIYSEAEICFMNGGDEFIDDPDRPQEFNPCITWETQ